MKKICFLFCFLINSSLFGAMNFLIIDTGYADRAMYETIRQCNNAMHLATTIHYVDQVEQSTLDKADIVLFNLDHSFLINLAKELTQKRAIKNPLLKKIITVLNQLAQVHNKTIIIGLPAIGESVYAHSLILQILHKLGLKSSKPYDTALRNALSVLLQADPHKSYRYHTALLIPKEKKEAQKSLTDTKTFLLMPRNTKPLKNDERLKPLYPFGLFIKQQPHNNLIFVVNQNYFDVAAIGENIFLNPFDPQLRTIVLKTIQQLLYEIKEMTQQQKKISSIYERPLPTFFSADHTQAVKKKVTQTNRAQLSSRYQSFLRDGIVCGFMDLHPYLDQEKEVAQSIFDAGINLIWLRLAPEFFLSDIAVRTQQEKDDMLMRVRRFTKALKEKAQELGQSVPPILVGMEMSGNYGTKPVPIVTIDAYGTRYTKIPAPLDYEGYWQQEVTEVLKRFADHWHKEIGNGLPLSGVLLDFEMYHAQNQTGEYTNLMDFSNAAWQHYCAAQNDKKLCAITSHKERLDYLIKNKKMAEYFDTLEQQAKKLGNKIKNDIETILPNGIIAAYSINLPYKWFYKGIMAGLSTPTQPLILATFNNNYYRHYAWLTNHNIQLLHLSILLLSKLQHQNDFKIVMRLLHNHDGLWINRFSRLFEPRTNENGQWDFGLETSPLTNTEIIQGFARYFKKENL